jgi:hypothetical protein
MHDAGEEKENADQRLSLRLLGRLEKISIHIFHFLLRCSSSIAMLAAHSLDLVR